MRYGFDDFAVQDPSLEYLLSLPAQIDSVLERSSSARAPRRLSPSASASSIGTPYFFSACERNRTDSSSYHSSSVRFTAL